MSEWVQNVGWDHRLRIQAWIYSLVMHIAMIGLMMALGTRMTLAPQDDPFRWNVAMVEPVSPTELPAQPTGAPPVESPSQSTQQTASRTSMASQTSKPVPVERRVETAVPRVMQPIETKPQEQIIERKVQTVEAMHPRERMPEARPSAVETAPSVAPQPTTAPAAIERPAQVAEASPTPMEHVVEAAQMSTREVVQHTEVNRQSSPTVEHADPVVTERTMPQPVEQTPNQVVQETIETAPATHTHETASVSSRSIESTAIDQQPVQAVQEERTVVAKAAPTTTPSPRADYGWVRDALWRRIVEMKHYPSQARLNHLEGKVILRAVIKSDGQLADLMVKESSGHRILDEAAMEVIRRICPVPLKHALGKPEIVVMIPIDYRLE
ncbi:MAG TPA: TonB family protein [Nitrospiraceae bacterium]|nr:TonB family protein [Nitrospiraceae bacterium]